MKLIKAKTLCTNGKETIQFIDANQIMSIHPTYEEYGCNHEKYFGIEFYQAAYVHAVARLDSRFENEKLFTKLVEKLVQKLKQEDIVDINELANKLQKIISKWDASQYPAFAYKQFVLINKYVDERK